MRFLLLFSGIILSLFCCWTISACTTFVVTPGASSDGTMYIGHTNDGYGSGLVGPYPDEEISNGMLWDPVRKKETLSGYPDWWYNLTGFQYGPRVYRTDLLHDIPGLVYTNTTKPFSSTENPQELFS